MLLVKLNPRVALPGAKITIKIRTDETDLQNASSVDIKGGAIGKLRGYGSVWWSATLREPSTFVGECEVPLNCPVGVYAIHMLTFMVTGKPNLVRNLGIDFEGAFFEVGTQTEKSESELKKTAERLVEAQRSHFFSGTGPKVPGNRPFHVFVFFGNAFLRGGDILLEKARLLRLRGIQGQDVIALANQFFKERFGMDQALRHDDSVRDAFMSANPCLVIHFPNVFASDPEEAFKYVRGTSEVLRLLIALDSGSSPRFLLAGIIEEGKGAHWLFDVGNYRGNLIAPFFPSDFRLNQYLEMLDNKPELKFFISLYADACLERVSDLSYFRYWALLESVAQNQGYGPYAKGLKSFLESFSARNNVDLGPVISTQKYTFDQCFDVWQARRNIAAHFGAFDPNSAKQQTLQRKSFDVSLAALSEIERVGHDFYLNTLRSTSEIVVWSLFK